MSELKLPLKHEYENGEIGRIVDANGDDVLYVQSIHGLRTYDAPQARNKRAAHIVQCVNSHYELVRQRDELLQTLNAVLNVSSAYIPSNAVYEFESGIVVNVKDIIEKAKNKCKGGKK